MDVLKSVEINLEIFMLNSKRSDECIDFTMMCTIEIFNFSNDCKIAKSPIKVQFQYDKDVVAVYSLKFSRNKNKSVPILNGIFNNSVSFKKVIILLVLSWVGLRASKRLSGNFRFCLVSIWIRQWMRRCLTVRGSPQISKQICNYIIKLSFPIFPSPFTKKFFPPPNDVLALNFIVNAYPLLKSVNRIKQAITIR
ncbi:hypothetical protein AGLY_015706 [Aphis glycines]|uniref:Uncharacterized protein n=1 Tax=Aphis glycines TaxID=307491 RepID=A0A6G0T092_APHGL|nr:hypothetical protein AGLY_015706 [Aphis glycines]